MVTLFLSMSVVYWIDFNKVESFGVINAMVGVGSAPNLANLIISIIDIYYL